MGMDVIAYTASPRTTPESKKDTGYIVPGTGDPNGFIPSAWYSGKDKASLHNFLHQDIDILLISLPLTKETAHCLSAPEFEILSKKNAFIANISRGGILNQADLLTYLKKPPAEGGLRGAALDVTDPEPLPKDHEAWDAENIAITPHVSGISVAYQDRAMQILEINMGNLEAGRPLINLVDKRKGY
jgi:phosphoglycerate dehydrogenase-like enzyme